MQLFNDNFYSIHAVNRITEQNQVQLTTENVDAVYNGSKYALIELARFYYTGASNLSPLYELILSEIWDFELHELFCALWNGNLDSFDQIMYKCIIDQTNK